MIKSLSKTITFYVGVLLMFLGGIFFIIISDLTFKNNAGNLIVAVLLCFGSAIVFFFSNNFVEKPVVMYVMKGIGLALAVGLIIYYHLFQGSEFYVAAIEKLRQYGVSKAADYNAAKASIPVVLAFSYVSMAAQAANIVLTAVFKDDVVKKKEEQPIPQAEEGGESESTELETAETAPEADAKEAETPAIAEAATDVAKE